MSLGKLSQQHGWKAVGVGEANGGGGIGGGQRDVSWVHLAPLVHFGINDVLCLVGAGACAEGEEDWNHFSRQTVCQLLCDVQGFTCRNKSVVLDTDEKAGVRL